jgi:hypothetical protein
MTDPHALGLVCTLKEDDGPSSSALLAQTLAANAAHLPVG